MVLGICLRGSAVQVRQPDGHACNGRGSGTARTFCRAGGTDVAHSDVAALALTLQPSLDLFMPRNCLYYIFTPDPWSTWSNQQQQKVACGVPMAAPASAKARLWRGVMIRCASRMPHLPSSRYYLGSLSAKKVLREPRGGPEHLGRRRVPEVRDNEPK